ncbi:hypothetical protein NC651_019205 [Populus alba x Populus x berolinensis]|nr:hypothetical protein NC651_019205 [Populus alba x Populus x berolinensis]
MGYLFLVLLVLASLCLFASSTDPRQLITSPSSQDLLRRTVSGATGIHQHDTSSIGDDTSERRGIVPSSKFAHGSVLCSLHMVDQLDTSNGGGDEHGS